MVYKPLSIKQSKRVVEQILPVDMKKLESLTVTFRVNGSLNSYKFDASIFGSLEQAIILHEQHGEALKQLEADLNELAFTYVYIHPTLLAYKFRQTCEKLGYKQFLSQSETDCLLDYYMQLKGYVRRKVRTISLQRATEYQYTNVYHYIDSQKILEMTDETLVEAFSAPVTTMYVNQELAHKPEPFSKIKQLPQPTQFHLLQATAAGIAISNRLQPDCRVLAQLLRQNKLTYREVATADKELLALLLESL